MFLLPVKHVLPYTVIINEISTYVIKGNQKKKCVFNMNTSQYKCKDTSTQWQT